MFTTRKSSIKKLLKEIGKNFQLKHEAIKQKRVLLNIIEDIARETRDDKLMAFWDKCSQECNTEEQEYNKSLGKVT